MPIHALDHLYVEVHDWEGAVSFWTGLGFEFVDRWGSAGHRAGRLEAGSAAVVLAEVDEDTEPAFNAFFEVAEPDDLELPDAVDVETPLSATHWGTRWLRVRDAHGRVYALEENPGG
jgi:catechol 2,3-dioxygenase-like lactoylglutathione lyase family enzyme